jgi:glycosyltransferase involved in cell wall biosynthesis
MKFWFALQTANPGGTERVALALMQRLKARGHECRVVALEPIAGLGPMLEDAGIPALGLDYRRAFGWPAYFALRRTAREYRPDVLFQMGHRLVTSVAALGMPVPVKAYYILHHHAETKSARSWQLSYALAALAYPRLLFLTEHTRDEAVELWPSIRDRSEVLYAPIEMRERNTAEQRHAARALFGLPHDAWIMGSAGRQVPVKRFDIFLRTAALVAQQRPEARFALAGGGPDHAALRALAAELGIADRMHWIEWQEDMEPFYRSMDLVSFNSDRDSLGMVPLEALARGVPVICSLMHGGLREILPWHGRYFFDRHEPEELATAALSLHGAAAEEQLEEGRRRIFETSDPERITDRLLALLGL